jgi:hypothetical protein
VRGKRGKGADMLIVKRKSFAIGTVLAAGFLLVLALIFSPVFGNGMNGLEYADDVFNKLSKGSSYFIPKVAKGSEKLVGTNFAVNIKMESNEQADRAATLLATVGAQVARREATLSVAGDLGQVLARILHDDEAGYRNDGAVLSGRYGLEDRVVLATWWRVLRQMGKVLTGDKKMAQAEAVHAVMKKAIEPAHNYYAIEAENVGTMAVTMTALLLFYILYTIWWGSAIYFLFEGVGLIMSKESAQDDARAVGQALKQS